MQFALVWANLHCAGAWDVAHALQTAMPDFDAVLERAIVLAEGSDAAQYLVDCRDKASTSGSPPQCPGLFVWLQACAIGDVNGVSLMLRAADELGCREQLLLARDGNGLGPALLCAASHGWLSLVQLLLSSHKQQQLGYVDPVTMDNAVLCAADGSADVLREVLHHLSAEQAQQQLLEEDQYGLIALQVASISGNSEKVALLLQFCPEQQVRANVAWGGCMPSRFSIHKH